MAFLFYERTCEHCMLKQRLPNLQRFMKIPIYGWHASGGSEKLRFEARSYKLQAQQKASGFRRSTKLKASELQDLQELQPETRSKHSARSMFFFELGAADVHERFLAILCKCSCCSTMCIASSQNVCLYCSIAALLHQPRNSLYPSLHGPGAFADRSSLQIEADQHSCGDSRPKEIEDSICV